MTKKPGFILLTYGCQMNIHDSEKIAGILQQIGYVQADAVESADLILLNTCCVRENAENKVYGKVGELRRLKNANPELIIGVCGCMAQEPAEVERIRKSFPWVDLVFGTHNFHEVPSLLQRVMSTQSCVIDVWDKEGDIVENLPVKREGKLQAWVNIMYGCNNFCTYCIVPYTRGRERSRRPEAIVDEVRALGREGFREVTLLGQNVNSYGTDLAEDYDFADLLRVLNTDDNGIFRIRYTTSHPRDCTDKVIKAVAESDKVCDNFHLPVQSGSNAVLARMNRGYTAEQYLNLLGRVREHNPGCAITTDLIVGFPGETDADFEMTLDLVRQARYDSAFMFAYSPRKGTPAADYGDQVPPEERLQRLYRLIELQNDISRQVNSGTLGQVVEVLVEGESETNPDTLAGRTTSNKLCIFVKPKPGEDLTGRLVMVCVDEPKSWTLHGHLVDAL